MSDFWTSERIVQLKELWQEYTASQILRIMGAPSRNAVLAKANRLVAKGELQPKAIAHRPLNPTPRQTRSAMPRSLAPRYVPPPVLEPEAATIEGVSVTVVNILHHQCRWPIGDPQEVGFHFCGHKKQHPSLPYCPFHTARAWTPAAARRAAS